MTSNRLRFARPLATGLLFVAGACAANPAAGPQPSRDPRIQLGAEVRGRFLTEGETHEYELTVQPGQHFVAAAGMAYSGDDRQRVELTVFRKHPVTGALEREDGTLSWAKDAFPVAAGVVDVYEAGTYVVRVENEAESRATRPTAYTLSVKPTLQREIALGEAVADSFVADGETRDYLLRVPAGRGFELGGSIGFVGDDRHRMSFGSYLRDPVTGKLEYFRGAHSLAWAKDGASKTARVVTPREDALYILRIENESDGGPHRVAPYTLVPRAATSER